MGKASRQREARQQAEPHVICQAERCGRSVPVSEAVPMTALVDGAIDRVCAGCYARYQREGFLYMQATPAPENN
jgi:hypothetical protein